MSDDMTKMDYLRKEIAAHYGEAKVDKVLAEAIAKGRAMHPDGELKKAYVYVALRRMLSESKPRIPTVGAFAGSTSEPSLGASFRLLNAQGVMAASRLWAALRGTKSTNSTSI